MCTASSETNKGGGLGGSGSSFGIKHCYHHSSVIILCEKPGVVVPFKSQGGAFQSQESQGGDFQKVRVKVKPYRDGYEGHEAADDHLRARLRHRLIPYGYMPIIMSIIW